MLAPGRHERGWPPVSLLCWTRFTPRSFRFFAQACGRRDAQLARGGCLEIVQWAPRLTPAQLAVLESLENEARPRPPEEPE
jgi:hypothetical protein